MDIGRFFHLGGKKDKQPQGEGLPVGKVEIFASDRDLEIQVKQREKGEKVFTQREPVRGGVQRETDGFGTSAQLRAILLNPPIDKLPMYTVIAKQQHAVLAANETFDWVRTIGESRKGDKYQSVASYYRTKFYELALSVKGNVSELRTSVLQLHDQMTEGQEGKGVGKMPMG